MNVISTDYFSNYLITNSWLLLTKTHQVFLVKYKRIVIHIFWRNFFWTHTYICVIFFSWPSFGGIIQLNKCFYMCFNVDVITKNYVLYVSYYLISKKKILVIFREINFTKFFESELLDFFLFKDLMLDSMERFELG